ncbi:hypothetical protein KCU95_g1585, partial [Aureobasidium melanogenum]
MDLPNELIRKICIDKGLKVKDLKSLRLTSKLLCDFVKDKFGAVAFFEVTAVISRPSLQALIELSQHPHFGRRVHYVDVSPMFTSENASVACNLEDMRKYMNRACGEKQLSSGDAERMLGIAFRAFAERKQPIRLAITDDEAYMLGGTTLLSITDHKGRVPWISDWRKTTDITIRAVHGSGCNILDLEIRDEGWQIHQYASSFDTDDIAAQLESVCAQLTLLDVEYNHIDLETTSNSVKRMVKAAKHLKELYLIRRGDDFVDIVPEIINNVASTSLRKIFITNFRMHSSDLIAFLQIHKRTLIDVEFEDACIVDGNCKDLVAWIKDNLVHLRHLVMDTICDHPMGASFCDVHFARNYTIESHEDMQACLADILDGKRESKDRIVEIEEIEVPEEISE